MRYQCWGTKELPFLYNYQRGQNVPQGIQTRAACRQSSAVVAASDPELRYHNIPKWGTKSLQKERKKLRKDKRGKTSESCRWRPSHQRGVKLLWWWVHHLRFTNISQCQLTFTGIYMLYWAFWSQTPKSDSFTHFMSFIFSFFFLHFSSLVIPILLVTIPFYKPTF